jgi:hypothetical protein
MRNDSAARFRIRLGSAGNGLFPAALMPSGRTFSVRRYFAPGDTDPSTGHLRECSLSG